MFNLNRNSKDLQPYIKFGLSLVDLCCDYDIHMLNGHLSDDSEANEGRSIVDYILHQVIYLINFHNFVLTIMIFLIISL